MFRTTTEIKGEVKSVKPVSASRSLLLTDPMRYFCCVSLCCLLLASVSMLLSHMSLVVRKPAFCICENKDADQLRGNREADQRLCFRYTDSAIPLLPISEISSL